MQLKDKSKKIRRSLTAATCSLLGISTTDTPAEEGDWEFDSAVLYYSEVDRVSAIEPVITAKREFSDEKSLNLKLVFDALTGASANGATPSDQPQTFTKPSGEGSYTASANETPLDDTFKDFRMAFSSQWDQPLNRDYKASLGGNFSTEYDYLSLSVNGSLSRDFNKRNTTLSVGISLAHDTISPDGDLPVGFSSMVIDTGQAGFEDDFDATREGSEDTKTTLDLIFGLTQVIDQHTVMQLSYSISDSSGYLTDPFKILSVVGSDGRPVDYRYEKRPDSRNKQGLYWQTKHHFSKDILDISYRFFWDDWDITSHTLDLRYRWMLGGQQYLEPHFRYYSQSEADFYRRFLVDGDVLPDYASADYRLGELTGITLGLKYGFKLANEQELSMRLEYYLQSGDSPDGNAPGILSDMELFPDVEAIILQFNYAF
ncbi:MAG: DUF3570 domain-containing protein [Candidatus Thiodiazotropha sp. (ex Epidulcina cf. delphinae)]|nr:DUF3570 domain-containing protein [Candidatus Thiodiazotropha sp. (ex Epidulcina cf. delphinae)]